jgi:hypothetical protein
MTKKLFKSPEVEGLPVPDDVPTLDVRPPHGGEWVRVKPGESREMVLIKDDGVFYLVEGEALERLEREAPEKLMRSTVFIACNNKQQNFLWPVKSPVGSDHPVWVAMEQWVEFPVTH